MKLRSWFWWWYKKSQYTLLLALGLYGAIYLIFISWICSIGVLYIKIQVLLPIISQTKKRQQINNYCSLLNNMYQHKFPAFLYLFSNIISVPRHPVFLLRECVGHITWCQGCFPCGPACACWSLQFPQQSELITSLRRRSWSWPPPCSFWQQSWWYFSPGWHKQNNYFLLMMLWVWHTATYVQLSTHGSTPTAKPDKIQI